MQIDTTLPDVPAATRMKYFRFFMTIIVLGLLAFGGGATDMVLHMVSYSFGAGRTTGQFAPNLPPAPKLKKSDLAQCQEGTVGKWIGCSL